MLLKTRQLTFIMCMLNVFAQTYAATAPSAWQSPQVTPTICDNVLYLPIARDVVKAIPIKGSNEELIDLLEINSPRIKPLATFNALYQNTYDGYSKIRLKVYEKLLMMLEILPPNIGIAYFEGFRPLHKQKEYFDKKFREILITTPDKEQAYQETCKHVSPFIDNVPPHGTGAAIDMTLFLTTNGQGTLLDMGKFDVIFGPNDQQDTFSENTTQEQRKNRLLLLEAAISAGLVNYGFEWWHYSYGDRMWAFVKKEPAALYDLATTKNDPILSIDKKAYFDSFDN